MSYSARITQMMPPEHIPQHVASASFTGFKCARHAAAEIAAEADATIAELVAALEELLEASDSMRNTYGCIQGRHPEEDDTHVHDKWAEEFLEERADAARAAVARVKGQA